MGSFAGHALPGSFFIVMSVWWIISIFTRYFKALKRDTRFKSSVTFPFLCCPGRLRNWPLEAMVKLFMVSVGFSLEIYTGTSDGKFTALGNGQHATMFFFFGITAVIDLLLFFDVPLPKDLDYVSNILAIGVEGLLFKFHLHGRTHLDVLLHTLLIYSIALNALGIILEMKYRHNILCALSRCYGFLLQGTWFWQVGFILYNPYPNHIPWKPDDHDDLMIATMFFSWHVAANFLVVLCIGGVIGFLHRRFGGYAGKDEFAMKRLIHKDSNGQRLISMHEESDSDIEFQKPASR